MTIPEHYLEITLRLTMALVLGGIIGIERSNTNHDAGMRTHILVCLGAATVMIVSEHMTGIRGGDIGRLGAQVISGIGFLGAGCILVSNNRIKGLTTAAGLWTTACLGLALGLGYYFIAIVLTALMLTAMLLLHPLASKIERRSYKQDAILLIHLRTSNTLDEVTNILCAQKRPLLMADLTEENVFTVKLRGITDRDVDQLIFQLVRLKEVDRVERG